MEWSARDNNSWTSQMLGADMLVDSSDRQAGRRLESALRAALQAGRLRDADILPSSRALARDLGVARGTVVAVYEKLISEGWLAARPGGRTSVAQSGSPAASTDPRPTVVQPEFDFRPGVAAWWSFPRTDWAVLLRRVLRETPDAAFGYGDPAGHPELRAALALHLGRARAVNAPASNIVILGGFRQGLASVCRLVMKSGGRSIAVEDPCLPLHRDVCRDAGLEVMPAPCDEFGLQVDRLDDNVRAVLVTPAHHYPLGVALAPERRAALVAWARARRAIIIEDDYDGEFRYDRQGIGALQALDPERVVYGGTASKSVAPGLRIGWLAVPSWLAGDLHRARETEERGRPILEQLVLAAMLRSTRYDQHIRRMRVLYRRRRDLLLRELERATPGVSVSGLAAGMQVVLTLPPSAPAEDEVVRMAARRRIGVTPLGPMYNDGSAGARTRLVINHAGPPPFVFERAVREFTGFLQSLGG